MKRILITSLQIAITAFLLWWIFQGSRQAQQMGDALGTADYLWLLPGLLSLRRSLPAADGTLAPFAQSSGD